MFNTNLFKKELVNVNKFTQGFSMSQISSLKSTFNHEVAHRSQVLACLSWGSLLGMEHHSYLPDSRHSARA